MRSSLISKGLLSSHIGRHIPLWVAFAAAWLVFLVLPLAILAPNAAHLSYPNEEMFYVGWSMEYIGSLIGTAIAGIASAVCVFDYAFNREAALFNGSLPIKRTSLFATSYLAGFLPLLIIELAVFAIVSLMALAIPSIGIKYYLTWLALTVGFTFVFYSVAVFCAMLAGTKTAAYYLYLLVLFFVPLLELVLRGIAGSCMWGVELLAEVPVALWVSPLLGMGYYTLAPCAEITSTMQIGWGALLIYVGVAVALLVLAVVLNKRRDLESAGNPVVFKGLSIVARIVTGIALASLIAIITIFCLAFTSEELGEVLTINQRVLLAVTTFLGGFLGVFFGEGLVGGSAGIFKRCWKLGLTVGVVCVLFIAGCSADVLGVKRYVPQASEVESVTVSVNGVSTTLKSEDNIEAVVQKHEEILGFEDLANTGYGDTAGITYKLKSGKVVDRSYTLYLYDGDATFAVPDNVDRIKAVNKVYTGLRKVCDGDEGVMNRLSLLIDEDAWPINIGLSYGDEHDGSVSLTGKKQMHDFVQDAVMKDVEEHGLGKAYDVSTGHYVGNLYAGTQVGDSYRSVDIDLFEGNCPNVAKWIKSNLGVDILK